MNNVALRLGASTLIASLSTAVVAEDGIILYGVGANSCGAFVQAYREGPPGIGVPYKGRVFSASSNLYAQWLAGFFSSYNSFNSQNGDFSGRVDIEGLTEWVRNYCEKNAAHLVNRAAAEAVVTLSKGAKR
jgi:hypothetical protein